MERLTSRERVFKAVNHEEPDRVPISFGGTMSSGILECPPDGKEYSKLCKYLGIENFEKPNIGFVFNIVNNTVVNSDLEGITCFNGANGLIKNNIIVGSGNGGIFCGNMPEPDIDYNNVWNNTGGNYIGCSPGSNDISDDPRFQNAVSFDFRLKKQVHAWQSRPKSNNVVTKW